MKPMYVKSTKPVIQKQLSFRLSSKPAMCIVSCQQPQPCMYDVIVSLWHYDRRFSTSFTVHHFGWLLPSEYILFIF